MTHSRKKPLLVRLSILAIVAGALVTPGVHAADAKGSYALHGIGALPCGELVSRIKDDTTSREQLAGWLLGYVSATNRLSAKTYDALPTQQVGALAELVGSVCGANPRSLVETAAFSVLRALDAARATAESPLLTATVNGKSVVLRKAALISVQESLIQRKLLKAKATGDFGKATEQALRDFQKAQGLAETGLPDMASMLRLLAPKDKP